MHSIPHMVVAATGTHRQVLQPVLWPRH